MSTMTEHGYKMGQLVQIRSAAELEAQTGWSTEVCQRQAAGLDRDALFLAVAEGPRGRLFTSTRISMEMLDDSGVDALTFAKDSCADVMLAKLDEAAA